MSAAGWIGWSARLSRFLTGQAAVQIINFLTGVLILRLLSIHEYATYILAALLVTVAALGSDMGVSQGVISLGAPIREDKTAFGGLIGAAVSLRRWFFALMIPVAAIIAYVVLHDTDNSLPTLLAVTLLALATAWIQQSATLGIAVLNAHHDSAGLTRAGLVAAVCRLVLVSVFCSAAPYAVTALAINLIGMLANAGMLSRWCKRYLDADATADPQLASRLFEFAKPLIPGIVYYMLQGQISVFLLALAGATSAVAEVGALGRLGQILGLLGMVNGFLIQPYFARIADRRHFGKRAAQVVAGLLAVCAFVTATTVLAPELWLAIIGPKYAALGGELIIAMAGAQLSVVGGVLYTVVIASRTTRGQWLQIGMGLGGQVAFLLLVGVHGTHDALLLNLIPAATYVALQCGLLLFVLVSWKKDGSVT